MATVDLSLETLEATIEKNDIVLIDFWAEWCGPCKMFAPTYEKVSEDFENIVFAKVDTEAHQELAAQFQIRSPRDYPSGGPAGGPRGHSSPPSPSPSTPSGPPSTP
jgi:thiol-disulfide isomerase/thioredoxin